MEFVYIASVHTAYEDKLIPVHVIVGASGRTLFRVPSCVFVPVEFG